MSDRYIEKSFLYLLFFSLLLHVAILAVVLTLPPPEKPRTAEAPMLDLRDMTALPEAPPRKEAEVKRKAERKQRVLKETAPKGDQEFERLARPTRRPPPVTGRIQERRQPSGRQQPAQQAEGRSRGGGQPQPPSAARGAQPTEAPQAPSSGRTAQETPRGEGIFKSKQGTGGTKDISKLFPGAGKLAKLEETYRKKYGADVEEGDTRFLNTDDILFGSFLRRFENAVYGVWHYPEAAVVQGIQGVTPVKITFNRRGEIQNVELLETSGSKILDDEVFRSLRLIGPMGSFPKGYQRDTFHLIAFFQYGIGGGRIR